MKQTDAQSSSSLAEYRTELAVDRTGMAAGRSLMAWVRTGLSLNGFGFTLYKFFQTSVHTEHADTAKDLGLFVIGLGIVSILLGCLDYVRISRHIKARYGMAMPRFPLIIASIVGGLGSALAVAIILRII